MPLQAHSEGGGNGGTGGGGNGGTGGGGMVGVGGCQTSLASRYWVSFLEDVFNFLNTGTAGRNPIKRLAGNNQHFTIAGFWNMYNIWMTQVCWACVNCPPLFAFMLI